MICEVHNLKQLQREVQGQLDLLNAMEEATLALVAKPLTKEEGEDAWDPAETTNGE